MKRSPMGLLASLAVLFATGLGSGVYAQNRAPGTAAQPPMAGQPMPPVTPPAPETDIYPGPPPMQPGIPTSVIVFDFQNLSMDKGLGPPAAQEAQTTVEGGRSLAPRYRLA